MRFRYSPEGADPREWDFEPGRLLSPEAEVIERHTGWTFEEWQRRLSDGSILAVHGLLFVLLKRTAPALKWDQVVFAYDEYDFILDDAETRQAIEALEAQESLSPAEAQVLEQLRGSLDEAPKAPDSPLASDDAPDSPGSSPTISESDLGSATA